MVAKVKPAPPTTSELAKLIDEFRASITPQRRQHPNFAAELDDFVKRTFDPAALTSTTVDTDRVEAGPRDEDENGWSPD